MQLDGGNRTEYLGAEGIVGRPYTIAFDWLARTMYIGNRVANNIQVLEPVTQSACGPVWLLQADSWANVPVCVWATEAVLSRCEGQ